MQRSAMPCHAMPFQLSPSALIMSVPAPIPIPVAIPIPIPIPKPVLISVIAPLIVIAVAYVPMIVAQIAPYQG